MQRHQDASTHRMCESGEDGLVCIHPGLRLWRWPPFHVDIFSLCTKRLSSDIQDMRARKVVCIGEVLPDRNRVQTEGDRIGRTRRSRIPAMRHLGPDRARMLCQQGLVILLTCGDARTVGPAEVEGRLRLFPRAAPVLAPQTTDVPSNVTVHCPSAVRPMRSKSWRPFPRDERDAAFADPQRVPRAGRADRRRARLDRRGSVHDRSRGRRRRLTRGVRRTWWRREPPRADVAAAATRLGGSVPD